MCDIGTVAFGFAFALFFLSCQKKSVSVGPRACSPASLPDNKRPLINEGRPTFTLITTTQDTTGH